MSNMKKYVGFAVALCVSSLISAKVAAQQPPTKVLVVNTQDASVSLVDLATMKELSRNPVGPLPY